MKPELETLLAEALEGRLSEEDEIRFKAAEEDYVTLAQQDRLIARCVAPPEDDFVRRVMCRIPSRRRRLMMVWRLALGVSSVALGLLAFWLFRPAAEPPKPPQVRLEPAALPVIPSKPKILKEETPPPPPPSNPPPPPVEKAPAPAPAPFPLVPPAPREKPEPSTTPLQIAEFKLGVVNLKTCFEKENYERIKEIDVELQKKSDEFLRKLGDIEKKMVELREQIDSLPRESPLRAEKMLQYRRAETDKKFEQEYGRTKYLEYYSDKKIEIYNEVRRVVAMIALQEKFDLILRIEAPLLEEQDPETVTQRINNRVVLYNHENVDITKLVLKRLNEEWAKTKAATSSAQEWECPICRKKNRGDACTATPDCKGRRP